MNRHLHLFLAFALLCGLASAAASAQQKPMRHLAYSFDISITQDRTVHNSGIDDAGGAGTGMTHYGAGNSDKGSITVDVMGVQPDTGLIVNIAEQGRGDRSAAPAMCVVYGIGLVNCEPNAKVNEEEMSLLRVLGRNFVNPATIDNRHHWQNVESGAGGKEINDYTIARDDNNGVLSIDFQRQLTVEGAAGYRADTTGNIAYNQRLSVPTLVKEDTVTRQHLGEGQDDRVEQQLTLTLTTDSLAQASVAH
jgi:hypothetical protein